MSLCKRGDIYWIRLSHCGKRIQRTTGTSDRKEAQRLHDKFKADLWKIKTGEKPERTWIEAATRWIKESQHKKSLKDDIRNLKWLNEYFRQFKLSEITRDIIDKIAEKKQQKNIKIATVNRLLALIRAILRKAEKEWEWLEKSPAIKLKPENNKRIRFLTSEQAFFLMKELPEHLSDLVSFSLATGLRQRNVLNLKWKEVNIFAKHAYINAEEAKGKKAIPVPLNEAAMQIIIKNYKKHPLYVFTYKGNKIGQCNTKAFRKALKRAGIEDFRWHDLRHTWASWHVQNGTSLQELQQLGGWQCFDMVLRYAHLSSNHLKKAAENSCTKLVQCLKKG